MKLSLKFNSCNCCTNLTTLTQARSPPLSLATTQALSSLNVWPFNHDIVMTNWQLQSDDLIYTAAILLHLQCKNSTFYNFDWLFSFIKTFNNVVQVTRTTVYISCTCSILITCICQPLNLSLLQLYFNLIATRRCAG